MVYNLLKNRKVYIFFEKKSEFYSEVNRNVFTLHCIPSKEILKVTTWASFPGTLLIIKDLSLLGFRVSFNIRNEIHSETGRGSQKIRFKLKYLIQVILLLLPLLMKGIFQYILSCFLIHRKLCCLICNIFPALYFKILNHWTRARVFTGHLHNSIAEINSIHNLFILFGRDNFKVTISFPYALKKCNAIGNTGFS